jgi:hypothetical protein
MEFERDIQIEAGHRQELWWSHADVSQVSQPVAKNAKARWRRKKIDAYT